MDLDKISINFLNNEKNEKLRKHNEKVNKWGDVGH